MPRRRSNVSLKSRQVRSVGIDGVTADDRESPPESPEKLQLEARSKQDHSVHQPELFIADPFDGSIVQAELPPLHRDVTLTLARTWYRLELEQNQRPPNTIKAYSYDLNILENLAGPKAARSITSHDIARYLGDASNKATRKRRLTSARRFFQYLIDERVLDRDPTEGFFPHHIELRLPVPLFPDEQERLLESAATDETWSLLAIWLMLRMGLTRAELLRLRRDHVDRSNEDRPIVYVFPSAASGLPRERSLVGDDAFSTVYREYLDQSDAPDTLVTVGPPAVNSMVERVRTAARIEKPVTPLVLRHTFAIDQAWRGADEHQLLEMLGLANDPRNRQSVDRYIRLARPSNDPVNA